MGFRKQAQAEKSSHEITRQVTEEQAYLAAQSPMLQKAAS